MKYLMIVLICILVPDIRGAIIQAAIELDSGSEDLIEMLIEKVDTIIDPHYNDSVNATHELAYALLRIGPLITIRGNISDGSNAFALSFDFDAKAAVTSMSEYKFKDIRKDEKDDEMDEEDIWEKRNGIFDPVVRFVEPWLVGALSLLAQGIVSSLITHLMYEACILSSVTN